MIFKFFSARRCVAPGLLGAIIGSQRLAAVNATRGATEEEAAASDFGKKCV